MISDLKNTLVQAALFAGIGLFIAVGQLMKSHERINRRIAVGRCLCVCGLSMAAGVPLIWTPDLPLIAQIGVAAALASLGTTGLEKMFQRMLDKGAV